MKFTILVSILFELLSRGRITAQELAEKHGVSTRTVYRYIDVLSASVPVTVKRGRSGGVCLSDSYKLPVGFMTETEYGAALEALERTYSDTPEERFLSALRKLSAQEKNDGHGTSVTTDIGNVFVDGGIWGSTPFFAEKVRVIEECLREKRMLELNYRDRFGEVLPRKVEPHVLVLENGGWYLYAFCHTKRNFHLFALGRIVSTLKTTRNFRPRPFRREDVPLPPKCEKTVTVRFAVANLALFKAQDLLGVERLREKNGQWEGEATLTDDETLIPKLLSVSAEFKVLAPDSLKEKLRIAAQALADAYR